MVDAAAWETENADLRNCLYFPSMATTAGKGKGPGVEAGAEAPYPIHGRD